MASSTTTTIPPGSVPPLSSFPSASTTGVPAGTTLTAYTGPLVITVAGTVIDGKTINGCLGIQADNVTIRRSRILCGGPIAVQNRIVQPTRLLLEDVEIDCGNHNTTAVGDKGIVVRRVWIHGCENGFDLDWSVSIVDSFINAPYNGGGAHADGIQIWPGIYDTVIRHNRIEIPNGTSAMIMDTDNVSMVIEGNWFAGGAWTIYCPLSFGSGGFSMTNNVWGRAPAAAFGPTIHCENVANWSNNRWSDGVPVSR